MKTISLVATRSHCAFRSLNVSDYKIKPMRSLLQTKLKNLWETIQVRNHAIQMIIYTIQLKKVTIQKDIQCKCKIIWKQLYKINNITNKTLYISNGKDRRLQILKSHRCFHFSDSLDEKKLYKFLYLLYNWSTLYMYMI